MMTATAKAAEGLPQFQTHREWLQYLGALPRPERQDLLRRKGTIDTAEAALYLDMKRKTLYNLINLEQGPRREAVGQSATGFGGRYRWRTEDLDAWDRDRTTRKDAYSR